ncbi:CIA30 family protein [Prochlorococcus sp. MIT 1341]|uniref:CIA30 family protein n=1 Tax=Prochlorococcus sp. MIT 1341 TaxID=3096221 RepID=UPI002A75795C|nr:CIA30 family protein [Prochlorococcus sp. MIT 1341]
MKNDLSSSKEQESFCQILSEDQFSEWTCINDTIMGGNSQAGCEVTSEGLVFVGNLVEEGGGFVSCCSPQIDPALDLSSFRGLRIILDGDGRNMKFAVACGANTFVFPEFFTGGVKWISEFPTRESDSTTVDIFFDSLKPTIRAKKVRVPLRFDSSKIIQFQLLHSKFGNPGQLNSRFRPGPIRLLLRSISGIL